MGPRGQPYGRTRHSWPQRLATTAVLVRPQGGTGWTPFLPTGGGKGDILALNEHVLDIDWSSGWQFGVSNSLLSSICPKHQWPLASSGDKMEGHFDYFSLLFSVQDSFFRNPITNVGSSNQKSLKAQLASGWVNWGANKVSMAPNVMLDDDFLSAKLHFLSLALLSITAQVIKGFHCYHSCLVSLQMPLFGGLPALQLTEISSAETRIGQLFIAS